MSVLTGYAVAIKVWGIDTRVDHTYVLSDGFTWGCWGRSSGGHAVCNGNGSATSSNCLSQTSSHAGIVYGVTGVCHQTANRILYPARVLVSGARGYGASSFMYGTYGLNAIEWILRRNRCMGTKASGKAGTAKAGAGGTKDQKFLMQVENLYTKAAQKATTPNAVRALDAAPQAILGKELGLFTEYRLGKKVAGKHISRLVGSQAALLINKQKYDNDFYAGKLKGKEYADGVNGLLADTLKKAETTLGGEAYQALFNLAVGEKAILVNPESFE